MEARLNFSTLNLLLKDLDNLTKHGEVVERKTDEENGYNGSYFILKLSKEVFGDNVYVRVNDDTDSYTENYKIEGIQFVQPTKVAVTDFQSL